MKVENGPFIMAWSLIPLIFAFFWVACSSETSDDDAAMDPEQSAEEEQTSSEDGSTIDGEANADQSDGIEEIDENPGDEHQDDGDDNEDGDDDCGVPGDAVWEGCESTGESCLPIDIHIFVGGCFDYQEGVVHFIPDNHAGYCQCGWPMFDGLLDMGSCVEGDPTPPGYWPEECQTYPRILCFAGGTTVLQGCCDSDGWVYCERNPLPCSNLCSE